MYLFSRLPLIFGDACEVTATTHLEVYDYSKDEYGGNQIHEVGQVLPVEGLSQSTHFVCPGGQQMEKSDDCSLKLSAWD